MPKASEFEQNLGNVEESDDDGGGPATKEELRDVKKRLETQTTQTQEAMLRQAQSQVVAELMKDPEMAALLRAKHTGKKVKIIEDDGSTGETNPSATNEEIPEDETDPKKIITHMMKGFMKEIKSTINTEIAPIKQRVEAAEGVILTERQRKVSDTLDGLRKKYPDFSDYEPAMVKLNAQVGGTLEPEQLYVLVKTQAGQPIERNKKIETERPSTEVGRTTKKKQPNPGGRLGLNSILDGALSKIDLNPGEGEGD
jgi:hypothetical protein